MSGAAGLLYRLAAAGVGLSLNEAGDELTLTGKGKPPAALLEEVKAAKSGLLALLSPANEERPTASLSLDAVPAEVVTHLDNLKPPPSARPMNASRAPDWAALSQQPGHCGSCARFTLSPDWGPYLGECGAVSRAWWPESAPLSIHMGHACPLDASLGYRSAHSGKTYGPRPLAALGAS